jgi:hypothetical protein
LPVDSPDDPATRADGCRPAFLPVWAADLATIREADGLANHLYDNVAGMLRISAPVTYGQRVLTPILSRFCSNILGSMLKWC